MFNQNTYSNKMSKTLEVFTNELNSLRTGRANASMLDLIRIDVYGQKMPINQLATVTTPEPRTINIQVWDTNNVQLIDSSIKKSELGLNPQIEGQLIRLPIPDLSEERRNEMSKIRKGASGGNRLPVTPTVIEEVLPEALPVPSATTTPTTQTGVDPNRLLQIQQQAYAQAYNPMLIGGFNPQFRFGAATPTIDYSTYFNY